jgi:hypothetical protein
VLHSTALDEKLKSGVLTRITSGEGIRQLPFAKYSCRIRYHGAAVECLSALLSLRAKHLLINESDRFLKHIFRSHLSFFLLVVQLLLSLFVLVLTQSFGGWVCFCAAFTLLGVWLVVHSKVSVRLTVVALLVALAIAIGWLAWVTSQRGFSLWNLQASENPIALRWNNYKTAIRIFCDFPGSGGLGTTCIDPRYQSSPTTVAQYAHNTLFNCFPSRGLCS